MKVAVLTILLLSVACIKCESVGSSARLLTVPATAREVAPQAREFYTSIPGVSLNQKYGSDAALGRNLEEWHNCHDTYDPTRQSDFDFTCMSQACMKDGQNECVSTYRNLSAVPDCHDTTDPTGNSAFNLACRSQACVKDNNDTACEATYRNLSALPDCHDVTDPTGNSAFNIACRSQADKKDYF